MFYNKMTLANIANENLDIIAKGEYTTDKGYQVDISHLVAESIKNTTLLKDPSSIILEYESGEMPIIAVYNEGIINAIIEEREEFTEGEIIALNFASAKNPGGGFLKGSKAQEECIMRATTLYPCLKKFKKEYYAANRVGKNPLYSESLIYTPNAVLIRDEEQKLIDYKLCSFITSAAVNKGFALTQGISSNDIDMAMGNRIEGIIKFAATKKPKVLILGAFGCGVFKNNPVEVAKAFRIAIDKYISADTRVVFSIKDNQGSLIDIFEKELYK